MPRTATGRHHGGYPRLGRRAIRTLRRRSRRHLAAQPARHATGRRVEPITVGITDILSAPAGAR
jgi:hypothetical protein